MHLASLTDANDLLRQRRSDFNLIKHGKRTDQSTELALTVADSSHVAVQKEKLAHASRPRFLSRGETRRSAAGWLGALRERLESADSVAASSSALSLHSADSPPRPNSPTTVTTYGSIATAILRHDGGTVGRLWLLLRGTFVSEGQSGGMSADSLWRCLTTQFARYSRRHLRDLLNRGEGVYWVRDNFGRLWLAGAATVAARLGVERVQGERIAIPLADLTGKLTRARTALQATFHASRGQQSNPISRAVLRDLTGVSERSQREQERRNADLIRSSANYCLDRRVGGRSAENHAYRHKQNHFVFSDRQRKQGGGKFLAHRLPNAYAAYYQAAGQGSRKQINKKLVTNRAKLVARGTGWQQFERVYYSDGATVVKAVKRGREPVLYRAKRDDGSNASVWMDMQQ